MNATKLSFALLLGLSLIGAPFSAMAQDGRDAAIARCVKVAQTQHPGDGLDTTQSRTSAYKACMVAAGFAP